MSYQDYGQLIEKQNKAAAWRNAVMERLGKVCVQCNNTDERWLQIDHIHGGGTKERRKHLHSLGYYQQMYDHLEDYQILCANCNWIKRHENKETSR
jgi:hypothetical protein